MGRRATHSVREKALSKLASAAGTTIERQSPEAVSAEAPTKEEYLPKLPEVIGQDEALNEAQSLMNYLKVQTHRKGGELQPHSYCHHGTNWIGENNSCQVVDHQ